MYVYKVELRTNCNYVSHIYVAVVELRTNWDSASYVLVYVFVAKRRTKQNCVSHVR
jgi:hypothetical protein